MRHTLFLLSVLVFPLASHAAPLSIQAQIIGAQGKLEPDKRVYSGSTAGLSMRGAEEIDESVNAPGVGLHMTYGLSNEARIGGNIAWVNYDEGNSKPQYQDLSVGLNASYDVYRINIFAFYGLGGFSYHRVESEDRTIAGETTKVDDADLVNFDLGIGSRMDLAKDVRVDIAYRFSDSLQKDDVTVDTTAPGTQVRGKLEDLSLQTNEVLASVGYQF